MFPCIYLLQESPLAPAMAAGEHRFYRKLPLLKHSAPALLEHIAATCVQSLQYILHGADLFCQLVKLREFSLGKFAPAL